MCLIPPAIRAGCIVAHTHCLSLSPANTGGAMPHTELSHGPLHYQDSGAGAPVVFLHGYLMGARLWDPVVRLLEDEFRCLVPELPFGAHPAPMNPGADLTSAGLGRLVA